MTVGQRWNKVLKVGEGANFFASQSIFDPILLDRKKYFLGGRDEGFFHILFRKSLIFLPLSWRVRTFFEGVGTEDVSVFSKSLIFLLHSPALEEIFVGGLRRRIF